MVTFKQPVVRVMGKRDFRAVSLLLHSRRPLEKAFPAMAPYFRRMTARQRLRIRRANLLEALAVPGSLHLVVKAGTRVKAYANASPGPQGFDRVFFIQEVVAVQGAGLGPVVVKELVRRARALGFTDVEVGGPPAHRGFYEELGFVPVGQIFESPLGKERIQRFSMRLEPSASPHRPRRQ